MRDLRIASPDKIVRCINYTFIIITIIINPVSSTQLIIVYWSSMWLKLYSVGVALYKYFDYIAIIIIISDVSSTQLINFDSSWVYLLSLDFRA